MQALSRTWQHGQLGVSENPSSKGESLWRLEKTKWTEGINQSICTVTRLSRSLCEWGVEDIGFGKKDLYWKVSKRVTCSVAVSTCSIQDQRYPMVPYGVKRSAAYRARALILSTTTSTMGESHRD